MIGRSGERGSGISVLAVGHVDDDDKYMCVFVGVCVCIYIYMCVFVCVYIYIFSDI